MHLFLKMLQEWDFFGLAIGFDEEYKESIIQ